MSETNKTNKLFVLAAPSGAGKTTLVHALVARNPDLKFSISYTTRKRRKNEEHGRDYFFVDKDEFLRLQETGELLESALVFDNYYGTSRSQVDQHLKNGRSVVLEIDWQGARQVREAMPTAVTVFIMPPSIAELERRLRDRKTDSDDVIARRLTDALGDMSHWNEFDYVIINDDLEQAVSQLQAAMDGTDEGNRVGNDELGAAIIEVIQS
jgi:guanylate kinase